MKKILSFVSARTTLIFTWIFAVMAPWLFYVCRLGHVYIDIVLFNGFCTTVFFIMAISAVFVSILAFIVSVATNIRTQTSFLRGLTFVTRFSSSSLSYLPWYG